MPSGWTGGIRTADVYATGAIATGSGGNVPTYMDSHGNIYASNSIVSSGNIQAGGNLTVGGNTNTAGETYTGGWFRTRGDTGWYSEKWGGGWYMSDSSWVRSYNNKSVYTAGQLRGGSVQSDGDMNAAGNASVNGGVYTNYLQTNGRLSVGEFAQFNGVAYAGNGCSPTGLQGRDPSGALLSCINGRWSTGGGAAAGYQMRQNGNNSSFCYKPNPQTGSCSCSSGNATTVNTTSQEKCNGANGGCSTLYTIWTVACINF